MDEQIKDWFKRFFCHHAWLITGMKDRVVKFRCKRCKKELEVSL